jgi:hypothetical protein
MPEEIVPKGAISQVLDDLNLPKLLGGPAGEAISRLVAGAADIPAEWLRRVSQGVKDKTEAKSVVSKAVADAAANLAKNDPEIIQRAAHSLLTKELRHQTNKESIAKKTIEILQEEPPSQAQTKIDDDWLNVFERFAEDANSERLQDLWAKVLSGEIRRPKTFSLQTLRFVAELDERTAKLFEKHSSAVISGDFIFEAPKQGVEFSELLELEEAGLLSGTGGFLSKTFELGPGPIAFPTKNYMVVIIATKPITLTCGAVLLTRVGKEIYNLAQPSDDIEKIKPFAKKFEQEGVETILYVKKLPPLSPPVTLWQKPASTAPEQEVKPT